MGAVNRCWKCGQTFALHPEMDGRPPVRAEAPGSSGQPLEAIVVEQGAVLPTAPAVPVAVPHWVLPRRAATSDIIDARRASMMAMGGTVTSIVLGIFAGLFARIWPPAAWIAVRGLAMGVWGLSSPRRNWAFPKRRCTANWRRTDCAPTHFAPRSDGGAGLDGGDRRRQVE